MMMNRTIAVTKLNEAVVEKIPMYAGEIEIFVAEQQGKYTAEVKWIDGGEVEASETYNLHANLKDLEDEMNQSESFTFEVRLVPFDIIVDNLHRAWHDVLTWWLDQTDECELDNMNYPFDGDFYSLTVRVDEWLEAAKRQVRNKED